MFRTHDVLNEKEQTEALRCQEVEMSEGGYVDITLEITQTLPVRVPAKLAGLLFRGESTVGWGISMSLLEELLARMGEYETRAWLRETEDVVERPRWVLTYDGRLRRRRRHDP